MSVDRLLSGITDLIVTACDPECVVLFGSYAKRQANIESDVDLVVVGPFSGSPYLRGQELRQLLYGYPLHIDVHTATPEEVARAASTDPYGYLTTALASGIVLYKKIPLTTNVGK